MRGRDHGVVGTVGGLRAARLGVDFDGTLASGSLCECDFSDLVEVSAVEAAETHKTYHPMTAPPLRRVLVFGDPIGIPQVLRHLTRDVVCALVAAEIRSEQHNGLRQVAKRHGLPLLIQPAVTSKEYPGFVEHVRTLAPDLIIVNSYSMRLQANVLAVSRLGAVNVHGALLPQYRGSNPTQWAR